MDPVNLATGLTALLAPLLPYLTGIGKAASDRLGAKLTDAVTQHAAALWDRLWPRLRDQAPAREAVTTVAADPQASGARDALARELAALLADDPELAQEAAALIRRAEESGVTIGVDTLEVRGDHNTVQVGEQNISIGQAHEVHLDHRRPQR